MELELGGSTADDGRLISRVARIIRIPGDSTDVVDIFLLSLAVVVNITIFFVKIVLH